MGSILKKINQRDVVLVKYPFTDLNKGKIRPVIVISNDEFNLNSRDIVGVPLTTNMKEVPYSLKIVQKDFEDGKLLYESVVRVGKILAIDKSIVQMRIGKINKEIFGKIKKELEILIK